MLRHILFSDDIKTTVLVLLLNIPVVMISLSLHETAHGYVAYKCGDGTAKAFGRLTLNPIKHLDFLGTIFMFLFGFGWAKPVPVVTRNLRKPKRDMALVSLAGPVSNLLLALVFAAIYMVFWRFFSEDAYYGIQFEKLSAAGLITLVSYLGMSVNVGYALFNLIPLPPLDGSNVLITLLPPRVAARYVNVRHYTRYIYLGVIVISWASPTLFGYLFAPFYWLCENISLLLCMPFKLMFTGEFLGHIFKLATWFAV